MALQHTGLGTAGQHTGRGPPGNMLDGERDQKGARLELGVEEGLDGGAGELEDELDEDNEDDELEPPGGGNEAVTQVVPDARGHKMQAEDDGQHDAPGAASCQEDANVSPLEVGDNVGDNLSCSLEGAGTEEDPQECHETEGQQPGDKACEPCTGNGVEPRLAQLVDAEGDTVTGAPNDEGPCGTVPESTEEHGDHEIEMLTHFALAVAAQGDIDIVAQPRGERDVPSVPELGDIQRTVREVEVDTQVESHDAAQTDCHVAVTREVTVDLHREAKHRHQQFKARVARGVAESDVVVLGDVVGKNRLLQDTHHDEEQTTINHLARSGLIGLHLWVEVTGPDDGTRHEAGEIGQEEKVVKVVIDRLYLAPIDIYHIADGAEGIERDADRQDEVHRLEIAADERIQVEHHEVAILEEQQDAQREDQ